MAETRKASVATRIYPHTKEQLEKLAKKAGLDCAAMLAQLIDKASRKK